MRNSHKNISQHFNEKYRHLIPETWQEKNESIRNTLMSHHDRYFIEKTIRVLHAKKEWNPLHFKGHRPII
jgi:hypothetical protein